MKNPKNNKRTIGTIVSLAVAMIVYFLVKQFFFAPPSFDKAMMQAASKMNEVCPIMVDQDTRLDNAIAFENTFQYNYTLIHMVKDSVDLKAFENSMQPMLLNHVKTHPDIKTYRDNKITMAFSYKDMNGEFITKVSITADQYSNNE